MAVGSPVGWVLDKSVAVHASHPRVAPELATLAGRLFVCPIGELEQLYSARSADDYDPLKASLHSSFGTVAALPDLLEQALPLQADLAHHHGMWHRTRSRTCSSQRPRSITAWA